MRARLLDATVACLFERGYARTTTTLIARRAKVSRGAQLHHFRTKEALVTTAVQHLFDQRTREFLDAFARLPASADRISGAVDLLWSMISGPTFYAWLELLVAARTDARLRKTVTAICARFVDVVTSTFHALFPTAGAAGDVAPGFAFAALQGLALDHMVIPEAPHIGLVIERMKLLGGILLPRKDAP